MKVNCAMLLAAGLGTRMRPLTNSVPKPLVKVAGKALIDHNFDCLLAANIPNAVVNVHHLPDQIISHCKNRDQPQIAISDERDQLLDSGGGIAHALPLLGDDPFLVMNCDTFWKERGSQALDQMQAEFDPDRMDILLLLVRICDTVGYHGAGDFHREQDGTLTRRGSADSAPYVLAGAYICKPEIFDGAPAGPFSVNTLFDAAIAKNKLHGVVLDGTWFHVGTMDAIGEVEEALARLDDAPDNGNTD